MTEMRTNADVCLATYNKAKPFVKEFRTAIDIGCRDGDFARPMAQDFIRVKAFDYRDRLRPKPKNVQFMCCALGDVEAEVNSFKGVICEHREGIKPVVVKQKRLDQFHFDTVDLLKIDVEGHELLVLKGAVTTIEKCSPVIIIEENDSAEKWGKEGGAILFLQKMNYKIVARSKNDYILTR